MSASSGRFVMLFLGIRETKANAATAGAVGMFSSLALEGLKALGSVLSVCFC